MIVRWGLWKLCVDKRIIEEGIEDLVVVCAGCGKILKNPLKPIFANETQLAYCSDDCARDDVIEVARVMKETDPEWSGF